MAFTKEVLFQHLPAHDLHCGAHGHRAFSVARLFLRLGGGPVAADHQEQMFDHCRQLSSSYQVNKVGNLMSLYTNDLDTIQECFGDGILMFLF